MQTRIATVESEPDAEMLAHCLQNRLLPRRGYDAVFSIGKDVFLKSVKQPSCDVMRLAVAFAAGFRVGRYGF